MGIEGRLWSFTPKTEYETCPECGGTGKENITLDSECYLCNRLGRIKKKNRLVGIATSEEKAYEMRGRLEEEFEDAFEYQVCCMETDKITINDTDIRF